MEYLTRCSKLGDLSTIIEIHKDAFDGFFLTRMGAPFLKTYYSMVAEYSGGILLVAEHDGQLAGFVAGFVDPPRFYAAMAANKVRLLWPTLRGLLYDPCLVSLVLANKRRVGQNLKAGSSRGETESELSSIAVHPLYQGRGVGRELVRAFLDVSLQRGVKSVRLTTDATDNDRTHAFYLGLDFHRSGATIVRSGRTMVEYVFTLAPSPLEVPDSLIPGRAS